MTEPTQPPTKPLRTWRPMVLWSAGILLVLGLAWFVGAVAVPVWQVSRSVPRALGGYRTPSEEVRGSGLGYDDNVQAIITELGGPQEAGRRLSLFVRLPNWLLSGHAARLDSARRDAAWILPRCGKDGIPGILYLLNSVDDQMRVEVLTALLSEGDIRDERLETELEHVLREAPASTASGLAGTLLMRSRGEDPPK